MSEMFADVLAELLPSEGSGVCVTSVSGDMPGVEVFAGLGAFVLVDVTGAICTGSGVVVRRSVSAGFAAIADAGACDCALADLGLCL